jgi:hypothetical protein
VNDEPLQKANSVQQVLTGHVKVTNTRFDLIWDVDQFFGHSTELSSRALLATKELLKSDHFPCPEKVEQCVLPITQTLMVSQVRASYEPDLELEFRDFAVDGVSSRCFAHKGQPHVSSGGLQLLAEDTLACDQSAACLVHLASFKSHLRPQKVIEKLVQTHFEPSDYFGSQS